MIEYIIEIAVLASTDIALDKTAKRHRSARIVRAILGLLSAVIVVALIFVTLKYS